MTKEEIKYIEEKRVEIKSKLKSLENYYKKNKKELEKQLEDLDKEQFEKINQKLF